MKRLLLLLILSCFTAVGFAQGTYYWVGGTGGSWTSAGSWNTTLGGGGTTRATANSADILIFDGSNIGGGATGTVSVQPNTVSIGQLRLQNNASVVIGRTSAGTTSLTVANGLTVSANSALKLNGIGTMSLVLPINSIGSVYGNLDVLDASSRIYVQSTNGLIFEAGSSSTVASTTNPYGSLGTGQSVDKAVVFKSGASLNYAGGNNPLVVSGTSSVVDMQSGSNLVMLAVNPNGMFNGKALPNVIVDNNTTVNLSETFTSIENLTINPGSEFFLRTSGVSVFKGNIVNNGVFGASTTTSTDGTSQIVVSSSQLLLNGLTPQSISGTGTFRDLGALSVGSDAVVTLNVNLNLAGVTNLSSLAPSTSSISGKLIFSNNAALTGPGRISFRTKTIQNFVITSFSAGANVLEMADATQFGEAEIALGVLVSGPQIPANTYIIATNSTARQFTISNPTTASGNAIALTTKTHVSTSNPLGLDGSVQLTNTKAFGTDMDYTFEAATMSPFSTSNNNALGDVTFNAEATTNRNITLNGKLILNNAKLIIREGDVLAIAPTASFDGSLGNSAYIATASNTSSTTVGRVRLTDLTSNKFIPLGTTTHYTPITLNPTAISNFDINVFAGATVDGIPNGTVVTAAQKLRMVDAVWNINRTAGAGDVAVTLGWDNALEGADFANFANAQIGIAGYNGTTFGTFSGSGNAAANTATLTTSTFSPFIVGEANTTLPLTLLSFEAKERLNSVLLTWQTTDEVNLKNYVLQHKVGNDFVAIQNVPANNKAGIFNYSYTHLNPVAGVNYYRLVGIDLDGTTHPSKDKWVNVNLGSAVNVYPNPVSQKNITVSGMVKGDVIRILNIQGQVVASKLANGNQIEEIDVQHIQNGTYILSIENGGKVTSTKKVIKI